ncbi:MAG: CvpA family protein [Pseudomonadota bacterium]
MGSEFSWAVDALVVVLIVVSAYLAMVRGFFRELFALGSWIIAFLAAFYLAPTLKPMLEGLPGLGGLLGDCDIGLLVAFILVFGLALILAGLIIWMFSGPSDNPAVSAIDQILGLLYGALRGLVLVSVLLIAYQEIVKSEQDKLEVVENAAVFPYVGMAADVIRGLASDDLTQWAVGSIEAMRQECLSRQDGAL